MKALFARLRSYARQLRNARGMYDEMDEEMRFHLEMEADRLQRERGLDPLEARRQAAVAFGGVEKYKEAGQDARGLRWLGGLALDVRLGLRMLRKYPGLSLVGVLGMAVGIAVGAGVFSFARAATDPVVPLDEGERLVQIFTMDMSTGDGSDADATHLHDLEIWREELDAVADFGAYRVVGRNLIASDGAAEPLQVAEMSASGFRIARVPPLMGRYLVEEDERPGAQPVVVIGQEVWRTRFAEDPTIVGRTLRVGADRHMIVGVMPEDFRFPVNNRVWTPLRLNPSDYGRAAAPPIEVFGRLAPGATLEQAQAQLATLGRRIATDAPETHQHLRPFILRYAQLRFDNPGGVLVVYFLQFLVSLLLIVIAVNVAVLVYARTATRTGEIAVRLALGASRGRVVAQLFAEALVLSVLAAALGLAAAYYGLRELNAFFSRSGSADFPFWWRLELSTGTVLYVTALAVVAAGIIGVVPALKVTGGRVQSTLRELGGATGMRMGRTWTLLIVVQVAIAVAILPLVGALVWKELVPARGSQAVIPAHELLSARMDMEAEVPASGGTAATDGAFAARLEDRQREVLLRLGAEPGVTAVTFASGLPGATSWRATELEPTAAGERLPEERVSVLEVDPGLFGVFDVPLLAGRPLPAPEASGGASTAVLANRSFVEQILAGRDALGTRFRYPLARGRTPGGVPAGDWYEIVGVVSDFGGSPSASGRGEPMLYHPLAPGGANPMTIVARVQGAAPERLAERLREIALEVDPTLRLTDVRSLEEIQRAERQAGWLLLIFSASTAVSVLLFSAAGIHALMSFTVARRRKEVAIRTALGAHPRRMLGAVFARSLGQLSLGVLLGALLASGLLHGSGLRLGRSAALLLAIAFVIMTVGLLAAAGPARRALRIQPMEALREE